MRKEMNILVSTNEEYLEPLSVMLFSLLLHNKCNITVYILHFSISKKRQEQFKKKIERYKRTRINIIFIECDEKIFDGVVCSQRYKKEANLRLLLLQLLPKNINRILWLDVDIIVQRDIKKLYNYPDKGQYAVVGKDMFSKIAKYGVQKKLGLHKDSDYFNSGVMLFYLENMRKKFHNDFLLQWMYENPDKLQYPDQNALNVCLGNKVVWVDSYIYNLQLLRIKNKEDKCKIVRRAKIIHYNTNVKPWQDNYAGICDGLYWRYAVWVMGIKKLLKHYLAKLRA